MYHTQIYAMLVLVASAEGRRGIRDIDVLNAGYHSRQFVILNTRLLGLDMDKIQRWNLW